MKKQILSTVLMGTMALTLATLVTAPSFAACPLQQCPQKVEKPSMPQECVRPMSPEEHAKMKAEKRLQFESRLNLSAEQKAQLDKIKADEQKALAPTREKIKAESAKLEKLMDKERTIRYESMKKFEALLTPEQKAELAKMKAETREGFCKKMPKDFRPCPPENVGPQHAPDGKMMPPMGEKPMCPPDCKCKCHNPEQTAVEPKDCKCPCHENK